MKQGIALLYRQIFGVLSMTASVALLGHRYPFFGLGAGGIGPIELVASTTDDPALGTNTTFVADGRPTWLLNGQSAFLNTSGFGFVSGSGPSIGGGGGAGLMLSVNILPTLLDDSITKVDDLAGSMIGLTEMMMSILEEQKASANKDSETMKNIIKAQKVILKEHKKFVRSQVVAATSRIEAKATASTNTAITNLSRRAKDTLAEASRPRTTLDFLRKYQWAILFVVAAAIVGAYLLFQNGKKSEAAMAIAAVALISGHIVLTMVAHMVANVITFPLIPFAGSVILLYRTAQRLAPGAVATALRSVLIPSFAAPAAATAADAPGV